MLTLQAFHDLAVKKEKDVKKKAQLILNGCQVAPETEAKGVKRKSGAAGLDGVSVSGAIQKSDGINVPYILWGHSMKVQIAGVGISVLFARSWCSMQAAT